MDRQQSGSLNYDRDEAEDEQVLQPKIKRKRSLRVRPRHAVERPEEKSETPSLQRGDSSLLPFQVDHKYQAQIRSDHGEPNTHKHEQSESLSKSKRNLPSRRTGNASKVHVSPKSTRLNSIPAPAEDITEHPRENWDGRAVNSSSASVLGSKMPEIIQRRVCTVEYFCSLLDCEVINDLCCGFLLFITINIMHSHRHMLVYDAGVFMSVYFHLNKWKSSLSGSHRIGIICSVDLTLG